MATIHADSKQAPIDFVIPWVDGSDPTWAAERDKWLAHEKPHRWSASATGAQRYRDWGILRYWFRGVERFAPWVNTIHFVTWGHLPPWLNTGHPKLHIVRHEDFIPAAYLPTFNTNPIELNLHRIPGLAEQFTYFNDDMFLLRPAKPEQHFKNGLPRDFAALYVGGSDGTWVNPTTHNAMLINMHFKKREVIRARPFQWFNPRYGLACLAMTTLLLPFPHFVGMLTNHLPSNFLKSTFEELWAKEGDELDRTCRARFRRPDDYTQWLMQDWQRAKGAFAPIAPQLNQVIGLGAAHGKQWTPAQVANIIAGQKFRQVCLNDDVAGEEGFEFWSKVVRDAFEELLPAPCAFERDAA